MVSGRRAAVQGFSPKVQAALDEPRGGPSGTLVSHPSLYDENLRLAYNRMQVHYARK
jgi:hypothetical protein